MNTTGIYVCEDCGDVGSLPLVAVPDWDGKCEQCNGDMVKVAEFNANAPKGQRLKLSYADSIVKYRGRIRQRIKDIEDEELESLDQLKQSSKLWAEYIEDFHKIQKDIRVKELRWVLNVGN